MEEIFFVESGASVTSTIQPYLNKGYKVKSVTAQIVSVTGDYYNTIRGGFVIVLTKETKDKE